jgi:hypothetical protein
MKPMTENIVRNEIKIVLFKLPDNGLQLPEGRGFYHKT